MRKGLRATATFMAGSLFTVVLLTRCGMPAPVGHLLDGGMAFLQDAGLLSDGGGLAMQDAGASQPGLTPQTFTGPCDHTVTSGSTVMAWAVFDQPGFNTTNPPQLLGMVCGLTADAWGGIASWQQTPSGWVPSTADCRAAAEIIVAAGKVYVYCAGTATGPVQTATLTVIPTM